MSLSIFSQNLYWIIELAQGKGAPANYYSEVKDREYEEVKEVRENEVMDGDEEETATNPGVQKDKNNPEEYMAKSGNDTLPPPVVTSQEPPNQTIQQTPSDGECEVRTGDGGGSSQTADESQSYVNEDEDPSLNVHWPLTKNPAFGLPPAGILQSDHYQTADESQSYVNEDEDPSLIVHWPLTKNPAYGLPPVGIIRSDHDDHDGGGSGKTADETQMYVNEDGDPSLNVHCPMTKNPTYGLPPVGVLQSDKDGHDRGGSLQTADETQMYVNEDGDPSMNVYCPMTKNSAYGLPPVGILQSDHVNDNGTQ